MGRAALCFCGTPRHLASNGTSFEGVWIQCDDCSRWCHGECAGFDKVTAEAAETYSCPGCTTKPRQAPLSARQRPTHGCELVPSAQAGPASKAQGGRKRAKATAAARDAASNAAAAAPGTAAHAHVSAVSAPAGTPAVPTADAHARDLPTRVRKPLRPYEAGPAPPPNPLFPSFGVPVPAPTPAAAPTPATAVPVGFRASKAAKSDIRHVRAGVRAGLTRRLLPPQPQPQPPPTPLVCEGSPFLAAISGSYRSISIGRRFSTEEEGQRDAVAREDPVAPPGASSLLAPPGEEVISRVWRGATGSYFRVHPTDHLQLPPGWQRSQHMSSGGKSYKRYHGCAAPFLPSPAPAPPPLARDQRPRRV